MRLATWRPRQREDPNASTVIAEIALERGDCRSAAETYAAASQRSDVAVARRASEVALACEHLPAAWESVKRWRTLAPTDRDAAAVYATVALKLYRVADARSALTTVLKAKSASDDTGAKSGSGKAEADDDSLPDGAKENLGPNGAPGQKRGARALRLPKTVKIEKIAPLGDPISIMVAGYNLSLRKTEADHIWVEEI